MAPESHTQDDTPRAVDQNATDAVVSYGLLLVDAIDGYVGQLRRG
jgi:hypothetical protein